MNGEGKFRPIFPAHAIERCTASVFFFQPVPDKFIDSIRAGIDPIARSIGLLPVASQPARAFQIDVLSNRVTPLEGGGGPSNYASPDGSLTLAIASNVLIFQTSAYVRWAPFIGQFDELTAAAIEKIVEVVPISVVKLEYVDRFLWDGSSWDDIDYANLIAPGTGMVAASPMSAAREWHSHAGWFDQLPDRRRLLNVNVDVVEVAQKGMEVSYPSVGILTLAQDQPLVANPAIAPVWADGRPLASILDEQHRVLKNLLGAIITPEMAAQISLRAET